jgi:hypothetical protein
MSTNHSIVTARVRQTTVALLAIACLAFPRDAAAQWSRVFDQFYFPDKSNWAFRHTYPGADRLFNAFDYGHAILYERLYTKPGADPAILEDKEYNFLTREVLVHPPRVPLEEAAIEVAYVKLAPEAKAMFEWAHVLHRQIYDIWADERIQAAEKDARVATLLAYYRSRPDLAYSSKPKSMELMEGQYYSLVFRQRYPKFNGLIWAYHWLQIGLYEPLIAGKNLDERQTGVIAAVAQFRHMIENPPTWMPRTMPMTPAVAPRFTERYPEAAAIFDNLHAMHDVISDILASEKVPRNQKRAEILKAAARFRDDTSFVMTVAEWKEMATMMGVQNMGGPVTGVLAAFPTPTIERGAPAHSAMQGMQHGAMPTPKDTGHVGHQRSDSMPQRTDSAAAHEGHMKMDTPMVPDSMRMLHERMMADPVIRQRIMADTALRRMMDAMMPDSLAPSAEHAAHGEVEARKATAPAKKPPAAKRPTVTTQRPTTRAAGTGTSTKKPATAAKQTTNTKTKAATKATGTKKPATTTKTQPVDHSKMKMPPPTKP